LSSGNDAECGEDRAAGIGQNVGVVLRTAFASEV
jgi:hypothetical protein